MGSSLGPFMPPTGGPPPVPIRSRKVFGQFVFLILFLLSVGAGALGTVALLALYPLRLTPARLVATDLAHALPLALVAGAGHAVLGHVDYGLLANLLLGLGAGIGLAAAGGSPVRLPAGGLSGEVAAAAAWVRCRT